MSENGNAEFEFRLLMFVSLSVEADKWAYFLKGKVSKDFKYRLDNFLTAAQQLHRFCMPYLNEDDLNDTSEVFSRLLEKIAQQPVAKRQQMIAMLSQVLNTKNENIDHTPEPREA